MAVALYCGVKHCQLGLLRLLLTAVEFVLFGFVSMVSVCCVFVFTCHMRKILLVWMNVSCNFHMLSQLSVKIQIH